MNAGFLTDLRRIASVRLIVVLAIVAALSVGFAPRLLAAATIVGSDDFKDRRGTSLTDHNSDWSIERNDGIWVIAKNALREGSKTKEFVSNDYRAVMDVGTDEVTVSADARFGGGKQFIGLVANHTDVNNWVMFFYDGQGGDMVLGAKSGTTGEWIPLGRAGIKWRDKKTRNISLEIGSTEIIGSVDGKVVVTADRAPVGSLTGTNAGLFFRGGGTSTFDNFLVTTP